MNEIEGDRRRDSRRNKRPLKIVVGIVLATTAAVIVFGASAVLSSITSSAETADVFTDAAELPPTLIDSVTWNADPMDLPRPMEPLTRVDVTASWLRAWEQLRIVSETGDTSDIEVYFSSTARENILAQAQEWDETSVRQLGHDLELTFYSEDGQVLGLRSTETRVRRRRDAGDRTVTAESNESYEAVMILEDGNWRIHHLVRRSFDQGEWIASDPQSEA